MSKVVVFSSIVRNAVRERCEGLIRMAGMLSEIDALVALSVASEELKLVRPRLNDSKVVNIVSG